MKHKIEVGDLVKNLVTGEIGEVTVEYGGGAWGVAMRGSATEEVKREDEIEPADA